jgi:hypothetical protein
MTGVKDDLTVKNTGRGDPADAAAVDVFTATYINS